MKNAQGLYCPWAFILFIFQLDIIIVKGECVFLFHKYFKIGVPIMDE